MRLVKGTLKVFGAFLGILLVLGIAQMAWGLYREPIAEKEAMDFCATISVGQSIEGIQERAIESGATQRFAKWRAQGDGSQTMDVMFFGMPPFSRHICYIKATTTTVVSAEYVYLD